MDPAEEQVQEILRHTEQVLAQCRVEAPPIYIGDEFEDESDFWDED